MRYAEIKYSFGLPTLVFSTFLHFTSLCFSRSVTRLCFAPSPFHPLLLYTVLSKIMPWPGASFPEGSRCSPPSLLFRSSFDEEKDGEYSRKVLEPRYQVTLFIPAPLSIHFILFLILVTYSPHLVPLCFRSRVSFLETYLYYLLNYPATVRLNNNEYIVRHKLAR